MFGLLVVVLIGLFEYKRGKYMKKLIAKVGGKGGERSAENLAESVTAENTENNDETEELCSRIKGIIADDTDIGKNRP